MLVLIPHLNFTVWLRAQGFIPEEGGRGPGVRFKQARLH